MIVGNVMHAVSTEYKYLHELSSRQYEAAWQADWLSYLCTVAIGLPQLLDAFKVLL